MVTVGRLAFHVHHDQMVEILTEEIAVRKQYILGEKPASEVPTRLRLLALVQDVPDDLAAQAAESRRLRAESRRLGVESDRLRAESRRLGVESYRLEAAISRDPRLIALHDAQCQDCPWDGQTIFPNAR